MTITQSNLAPHVTKCMPCDIGSIMFFEHISVLEIDEGVHLNLKTFKKTIHYINDHFGFAKPFGLLCNRVNSYSVDILDIEKVPELMPNMVAYGTVVYNEAGRMNALIQSQFCNSSAICFENLYEGLDAVNSKVKRILKISLNQTDSIGIDSNLSLFV